MSMLGIQYVFFDASEEDMTAKGTALDGSAGVAGGNSGHSNTTLIPLRHGG